MIISQFTDIGFASLALIFYGTLLYQGSHNILSLIFLVFDVLEIITSIIFLYKLFSLKKDLLFWTDVTFNISMWQTTFKIIFYNNRLGSIFGLILILIVWFSFRKHVKNLLKSG